MQAAGVLPGSNHEPVAHQDWGVPCASASWGPGSRPAHAAAPFHAALLYDGFLQEVSQEQERIGFFITPLPTFPLTAA